MKHYYVYIMASLSRRLYVGVTDDLERRVCEHKSKEVEGFTSRYNINRLVYIESSSDISSAVEREKAIKGWLRKKKIALVESTNPAWKDLADEWIKMEHASRA